MGCTSWGLRDYATRGAHGQVAAEEFFGILAEHSAADLSALVRTYFGPYTDG